MPPPGYFQRVAEIIRKHGGLFISDEVQAGFGPIGGECFGIVHCGVEPDIMVVAKTVAGGMPVGATIATDEVAAWKGKSICTCGGNPVGMTALDATAEIMQREDVPGRSARPGRELRAGLERLGRASGRVS